MNAAREVFSEVGYDAATFQEIAERADLTRPAINHYFKSKRLLYAEVIETTNTVMVSRSAQRAQEANSMLGRLAVFIDAATKLNADDRSMAAFLVTSVLESQRHPELRHGDHDALTSTRAFLTWTVVTAIEEGELATDVEVESLVEMLMAMLWGMGFYAGFVGSHEKLLDIERQFLQLCAGTLWKIGKS